MRIDVHSHLQTPNYLQTMVELGAAEELESFAHYGPYFLERAKERFANGVSGQIAARIREMDAVGVDVSIVGLGGGHPYFEDPGKAMTAVTTANDEFAEVSVESAGRLRAFGTLPLPHVDETLGEIARIFDRLGHVGVNLGCSVAGRPLDDPRFEPVWAELDRRGAVVFIHPGTTPRMGVGSADYHLAPDFCSPAEIAIAACRLIVKGVPERYPNLKIVLATYGGSIPFLANRFDRGFLQAEPDRYHEMGGVLRHFRRLWYDTSVVEEPLAILAAKETYGADRIVLGTDVPRGPATDAISRIESSPHLTDEEKRAILDTNASLLFGDVLA